MTSVTKYVRVELKSKNVSFQISSPIPLGLYLMYHLWSSQDPQLILEEYFQICHKAFFQYPQQIFFYPFSIM